MSAESSVRQSDYGVKPYSMLMGSVQVADEVTVVFHRGSRQGWLISVATGAYGCAGACGPESPVSPGMCSSTLVK